MAQKVPDELALFPVRPTPPRPPRRRSPIACVRTRSTISWATRSCSARASRCARPSSKARSRAWCSGGRPGCGKTTLARLIAHYTDKEFVTFSAVTEGVPRVREIIREAEQRRQVEGRGTILFCDEIHRFNRAQQDAFLPSVEAGVITLVGATTENPSFELNSALLSRLRVFVLEPLGRKPSPRSSTRAQRQLAAENSAVPELSTEATRAARAPRRRRRAPRAERDGSRARPPRARASAAATPVTPTKSRRCSSGASRSTTRPASSTTT